MLALALSACGGGGSSGVTPVPNAANGGSAAPSSAATATPAASTGGPSGNITSIGIPAVQASYAPSNGVALTSNVIDGGAGNYSTIATTNGGTATASCADPANATTVRCFAYLFNPLSLTATPNTLGLTPSNFQTYYGITSAASANGGGVTIAIVDAYDAPNVAADMARYRSTYGLSSGTLSVVCQQGTASGTFGSSTAPCVPTCATGTTQSGCKTATITAANSLRTAWVQEIALDVEMVSAICPNCSILLVEAATSAATDMGMATLYAAGNAQYISGSYGGAEAAADLTLESSYYAPAAAKAALFAATGDKGFAGGRSYPATSPSVIAVGGTILTPTTTAISGFNETSWAGSGDGCSAYFTKVTFQSVALCGSARTVADVSANAGYAVNICNSGIGSATATCWTTIGGTSAATPVVASMYALANGTNGVLTSTTATSPVQALLYTRPDALTDIYKGADNGTCGSICDPAQGFDGVTGVGSPHGLGALTSGTSSWHAVPFITGITPSDIAIGGSTPALWAIGSNYLVYQYRNDALNEWGQPAALPTTTLKAVRIAAEPSTGNPWVIASTGQVYRGSTNTPAGMTWTAITASKKTAVMSDIAITGSSPAVVYTVDTTGQLYSYSIGSSSTLTALSPQPTGGCCTGSTATHIAADPNGSQLWIVNTKGQIWGSSGSPPSSFSQLQPGLAQDIAIGSSSAAYVIGADLNLWQTSSTSGASTYSWLRGSVSRVAVDGNSGGNVWVLESNNSALYVNSSTLAP